MTEVKVQLALALQRRYYIGILSKWDVNKYTLTVQRRTIGVC